MGAGTRTVPEDEGQPTPPRTWGGVCKAQASAVALLAVDVQTAILPGDVGLHRQRVSTGRSVTKRSISQSLLVLSRCVELVSELVIRFAPSTLTPLETRNPESPANWDPPPASLCAGEEHRERLGKNPRIAGGQASTSPG